MIKYPTFFFQTSCCCLPTPMTLASGGSPMSPLVVYQPASPSIWPAVQSLRRGLSTNPGVTMWCICGCGWRDDVCGCYRGGIVVMDVFWRRLCASMIFWLHSYLCVCGCDCDVVCIDHDLNRCTGWW